MHEYVSQHWNANMPIEFNFQLIHIVLLFI